MNRPLIDRAHTVLFSGHILAWRSEHHTSRLVKYARSWPCGRHIFPDFLLWTWLIAIFGPRELSGVSAQINKCLPVCIIHNSWCSGGLCRVTMIFQSTHVVMSIMVAWRFLKQYHPRAWWSRAFSSSFRPWLLCTENFPDSLNLFTILWTVDG